MKAQSPWLPTLDTAAVARQSKSADDIIRSATFPAAHAPSLDDSSRSEGGQWPCSLAALGTVGSRLACRHCYLPPGGARPLTITWAFWFLPSRCGRSLTAFPLQPQSFLGATVIFFFLCSACIKFRSPRHCMRRKINCGLHIDITCVLNTNLSLLNIFCGHKFGIFCAQNTYLYISLLCHIFRKLLN